MKIIAEYRIKNFLLIEARDKGKTVIFCDDKEIIKDYTKIMGIKDYISKPYKGGKKWIEKKC